MWDESLVSEEQVDWEEDCGAGRGWAAAGVSVMESDTVLVGRWVEYWWVEVGIFCGTAAAVARFC